jgi:hypothetical protein
MDHHVVDGDGDLFRHVHQKISVRLRITPLSQAGDRESAYTAPANDEG